MLLAASCFFYMFFKPIYILILLFTIVIDYYAGILIENAEGPRRKFYLLWSLIANIGVLAIFKYYNFINENITTLLSVAGFGNPIPFLKILLPIGLSFHTFQAMSYTIEVYRGNYKAERKFGIYALYVMFYPQLVAGPIERPQNIIHQFYEKHDVNYERMVSGFRLMLMGFFKKVVIADRMALIVTQVFSNPAEQNGLTHLIAMYFFTIQLYCDFAGYSDIARGCARVMGYELMLNFSSPYLVRSIQEYWAKWHISLSSWFRDYLYIPLGGGRVSYFRKQVNIFIVFFVSGVWHGANWTYITWGSLQGIFIILANLRRRFLKTKEEDSKSMFLDFFNWFWTFHLIVISLILIRSRTIVQAWHIFISMMTTTHIAILQYLHHIPVLKGFGRFDVFTIFLLLASAVGLVVGEYVVNTPTFRAAFYRHTILRWVMYFSLFYAIIFLGYFGETQFIYFQF